MPKFTPGPWYLTHHGYEDITGEWDGTIWAEGDENYIGQCYGEANARLIAAAPAMYEACRDEYENYLRQWEQQDRHPLSRFRKEVEFYRELLALADGGDDE